VSSRVLAIDLGTRRIGLALSDPTGTLASPLQVLERAASVGDDHAAIAALVREHDVGLVLVGLPRSLSGTEGAAAGSARSEIGVLGDVLDVPIEPVDERFTTVAAHRLLGAAGKRSKQRRETVDAAAAAVLLQGWLDARAAERRS
jgi:putative Holliday junction resolvase